MNRIQDLTRGRWPDLLQSLAGLSAEQLTNKHQPCPLCGGKDRYRFDDHEGTGSWYCNKCGGKDHNGGGGSGMEMLMRRNDWTFKEAAEKINQRLTPIPPPELSGWDKAWHYTDTFYVLRRDLANGEKKIRPYRFNGQKWEFKHVERNRPILNQDDIAKKPGVPVIVVEGEKCADALQLLLPSHLVTAWPGGANSINLVDWSPLANRKVILWPDNDDAGRICMAKLAVILLKTGVERVRIINPPADKPEKWDVADSGFSSADAIAFIKDHLSEPIELPEEQEQQTIKVKIGPRLDNTAQFVCLGFNDSSYYYQPSSTGQVVALSRSAHTGTNLCALAPLSYWETLYPSKMGVNWSAAASSLFEQSAKVGVYDPSRLRGRGAWWDNDRSVLHLGDRIIVDGSAQPSSDRLSNSKYIYQRLAEITSPEINNPLTVEESTKICRLAERFLWEVPASGLLLAGWVTLAPICGVLDWRPHAWLTAGAGSGKSTVMECFITPLLGELGLIVVGNTTEAGIRQALKADARPVVFDEAESNERYDQQRMQSILSLARIASFESRANLLKGTPDGTIQSFTIRSMFFMSSIVTALKQGADKTRFAQLTLLNPREVIADTDKRDKQWHELKRDLEQSIDDNVGRRLQARTISLIPVIRKSIEVFCEVAAKEFDSQRQGDQYGTLLAGAWSLISNEPATPEQARKLIQDNNWDSYSQATDKPDEVGCLERIMQHQIRVEGERTVSRSIGELVEIAIYHKTDIDVPPGEADSTLGRHGIKIAREEKVVIISNSAQAIAHILRDTAWANCWPTVLLRLPCASRAGVTYFKGAGSTSRGVKVPFLTLLQGV